MFIIDGINSESNFIDGKYIIIGLICCYQHAATHVTGPPFLYKDYLGHAQ